MSTLTTSPPAGRIGHPVRLAVVNTTAPALPRAKKLLLNRREAAAMLGMSLSHFQRHVQPYLRCVYSGQLRLYRQADLERWIERVVEDPARR